MRRTIGLINVTASRASATGVPRVYQKYGNTSAFRFVGHKSTKLVERPTMQCCPLLATNRNPGTDALQIFQGNRSICVFRFGNQHFANAMIGVFGKTAFFARKSLQLAFGRPRAFGLQFGSQAEVTVAHIVNLAGRVNLPIAIYRDVDHPQVNTQCAFYIYRLWLIDFAGGREQKQTFVKAQVAFSLSCLQEFQLPFTANKGDPQSAIDCPNRHGLIMQAPGQDTVIVSDTACGLESTFYFAIELIGIGNLGNRPHHNLCRKTELLTYFLIAPVMQVILPKDPGFPSRITDELASGIGLFQRMSERVCLFGCGKQFDLSNQFHGLDYSINVLYFHYLKQFLLTFFDVTLDSFRTYMARCTKVILFCPQRCVFPPIMAAEAFKLFFQPARCNPFDQANDLRRRKCRRCAHKQIHRGRHTCTPLKAYFVCGTLAFPQEHQDGEACNCQGGQELPQLPISQTRIVRRFPPTLLSILPHLGQPRPFYDNRYPLQMVIDYIRTIMWAVFGFVWHRPILTKESGFLHLLKRGGFRHQDL